MSSLYIKHHRHYIRYVNLYNQTHDDIVTNKRVNVSSIDMFIMYEVDFLLAEHVLNVDLSHLVCHTRLLLLG